MVDLAQESGIDIRTMWRMFDIMVRNKDLVDLVETRGFDVAEATRLIRMRELSRRYVAEEKAKELAASICRTCGQKLPKESGF